MNPNDGREKILIVDDSVDIVELLERNLEKAGFRVFSTTSVPAAIEILGKEAIDIVVTDLRMPGISGLELVRHIRDNLKDTEVLLITGYPSVDGAVEAMKTGAADYLPKPFTSTELLGAINRLLDKLRARRLMKASRAIAEQVPGMIGFSKPMLAVFDVIRAHAADSFSVLISGDCGTGRRSVARSIHLCGPRTKGFFATVDPLAPLEEWFDDLTGTFYVSEVAELSSKGQANLLRAIEGGTAGQRFIASSSIDLAGISARGAFDERLYNRLAAVRIILPTLTERGDDLLHLIRYLAERSAREVGMPVPDFTDRSLEAMRAYSWPGNVKELWWTIQRLVTAANGRTIEVPDLPSHMRFSAHGAGTPDRPLAAIEAAYIQEVLSSVGGNRTRAAEILGIDRKTLRQKVRRAATE